MGFEPHECVVIEDSLSGVLAARNGGFHVLGFVNPHNREAFEREQVEVFFDMSELVAHLQ